MSEPTIDLAEASGAHHPRCGPACPPLGQAHQARQGLRGAHRPGAGRRAVDRCQEHRQGDGHQGAEGHGAAHPRARATTPRPRSRRWSDLVERDFDEGRIPCRPVGRPAPSPPSATPPVRCSSSMPAAATTRPAAMPATDEPGCGRPSPPAAADPDGADGRSADAEAAAILEFQVAMIEDDSLSEAALAAIAAGTDAATAPGPPRSTAQIAGYEAADDDYFRARGADLRDIRDRVLRALAGAGERSTSRPPARSSSARDLTPTRFLSIDWRQGGGIALEEGSSTSHVAMLARARGVPMLVGLGRSQRPRRRSRAARRRAWPPRHPPPTPKRGTSSSRPRPPTLRRAGSPAPSADAAHGRRRRGSRCWSTSPSPPTPTPSISPPATASG